MYLLVNFLFWVRVLIKVIIFPVYIFLYLNFKILFSYFNILIRSKVTNYRITRKDRKFYHFSFLIFSFYILVYIGSFNIFYNYISFGDFDYYLHLFYSYISLYKYYFINLFIFTVPFIIIDELFFKSYLDKKKYKPGSFLRYFSRRNAIRKGLLFIGSIISDSIFPRAKRLYLSVKNRSLHVLVTGTTGSGKTESSFFPLLWQDISSGRGCIYIDSKGDWDFFNKIYTYHKRYNKNNNQRIFLVDLGNPSFSNTYNPFLRGSAIEIKDRIMGSSIWDNSYYKLQSENACKNILLGIDTNNKIITPHDLFQLLNDKVALSALKDMVTDDFVKEQLQSFLDDYKNFKRDTNGLRSNIDNIAHGGFGEIVNTYTPDIDLLEVYKNNDIVYFMLPTNMLEETAKTFGRMLLMDLKSVGSYIDRGHAEKHFFPVFVDEPEFLTDPFISWLNKARSSGFSIHIAHQSIGDFDRIDPHFTERIFDNCNLKFCFRVNSADTAERIAKLLGTFKTEKITERIKQGALSDEEDEVGSGRETDEFFVSPNVLKNELRQGQALIIVKEPNFNYYIVNTDYMEDPVSFEKYELINSNHSNVDDTNFLKIDDLLSSYKDDNNIFVNTDTDVIINNISTNEEEEEEEETINDIDKNIDVLEDEVKEKDNNIKDDEVVDEDNNNINDTPSDIFDDVSNNKKLPRRR